MQQTDSDYLAESVMRTLHAKIVASTDRETAMAVGRLLAHVRRVHRALDVTHLSPGLELIVPISRTVAIGAGTPLVQLEGLLSAPTERAGISLILQPNEQYKVTYIETSDVVPDACVKYVVQPFARESVLTASGAIDIEEFPGLVSPFALPYFRDLDLALQNYYDYKARETQCLHLERTWEDVSRLVLTNKPEKHMRRSLYDYLSTRLRDAEPEVIQEQNVNETEPVDIRIQWLDSRRVSLLEVKWIGDSVNAEGEIRVKYRDARAREGYVQLRDYVRSQKLTLPNHIVKGRVVVYDARRGTITRQPDGTFKSSNAWQYRSVEIDYGDVLVDDAEIDTPVRFYLEPRKPD